VRPAVSARRHTRQQGICSGLLPLFHRLLESLFPGGIAHKTIRPAIVPVIADLLPPDPAGLQVLSLGAANNDAAHSSFAGPE
jgi:hypothetical protein